MATNLFIDTNIFLSFYHLSGEDIEELKKLSALVERGTVRLLLPHQVMSEFHRSRDSKIAEALSLLHKQQLSCKFPQITKGYPEHQSLRTLQKQYETTRAELLEKIRKDVQAKNLAADRLVTKLFSLGDTIETTDDLVTTARLRMDLGNPPGKKGSLGDAINWEALLSAGLDADDLHFVTEDRDYFSPLDPSEFNDYLKQEWSDNDVWAELIVYKKLSGFFKNVFPEITLASEIEKDSLIAQLAASTNFAKTHAVIAELNQFPEFSVDQVDAILAAAKSNNQVEWIVGDADVKAFLKSAILGKEDRLSTEALKHVLDLTSGDEHEDEEGGPP